MFREMRQRKGTERNPVISQVIDRETDLNVGQGTGREAGREIGTEKGREIVRERRTTRSDTEEIGVMIARLRGSILSRYRGIQGGCSRRLARRNSLRRYRTVMVLEENQALVCHFRFRFQFQRRCLAFLDGLLDHWFRADSLHATCPFARNQAGAFCSLYSLA